MSYQKLEQGLKDFQATNKDTFQYTKKNWVKIKELNSLILQFKDDPQAFIDPNNEYSPVELQLRIAKLRAQISDYVDTIDWEQTKLRDIENQIEQKQKLLKEAQSRNRLTKMFSSLEQTLEKEISELEKKKTEYIEERTNLSSKSIKSKIRRAYKRTQKFNTAPFLDESQLLRRMHNLSDPKGKIKEDYVDDLRKRFKDNGPKYQRFGVFTRELPTKFLDLEKLVTREHEETDDAYIQRLKTDFDLTKNLEELKKLVPDTDNLTVQPDGIPAYLLKVKAFIDLSQYQIPDITQAIAKPAFQQLIQIGRLQQFKPSPEDVSSYVDEVDPKIQELKTQLHQIQSKMPDSSFADSIAEEIGKLDSLIEQGRNLKTSPDDASIQSYRTNLGSFLETTTKLLNSFNFKEYLKNTAPQNLTKLRQFLVEKNEDILKDKSSYQSKVNQELSPLIKNLEAAKKSLPDCQLRTAIDDEITKLNALREVNVASFTTFGTVQGYKKQITECCTSSENLLKLINSNTTELQAKKASLTTLLANRDIVDQDENDLTEGKVISGFVQEYDAQMAEMQTIYKKNTGETDSAYIQRATAYLEQEGRLAYSVGAYDALPKQNILLELQKTISRNPKENEKDYIERVEKIIELKNKSPVPTNFDDQLKRLIPPMPNETSTVYDARIDAIKRLSAEQIGEVEEYKELTQNPLLSLESQAILTHLKIIHPAEGQSDEVYLAQLEGLTTALGKYEEAKKAESAAPAAGEVEMAGERPSAAALAVLKELVRPGTESDEAYIQRISDIVDVYEKFRKSESDAPKAETLYSPPDNPLVSVTYHIGKVDETIEFPQAFLDEHKGVGCPLEFKAPVTTSAVVNARDGASLVLGPDGKLNIAVHQKKTPDGSLSREIDYDRVEKSENLMIANISKSLDTMKNPLIQLSNMKGYGLNEEDQKVRFIRKLVESYCIENGKVNLKKYVKLRNALTKETKTQSASLSYDELYSSKYEFLVRPQALLTKPLQPIKSVTDTQSFREKLKDQKAAVKSFKQQHDERSILERISGLSETRKEEFALAAIRELKAAGNDYDSPEFTEQRKFLKEYLKIYDTTKFKEKLQELMDNIPSESARSTRGH